MKKISVIIPCYNVAAYIDRCMVSIVAQTIGIKELEVICVDDASTDDTWEHLQKWEQLYPDNVLLIRQEKNRRAGAARNLGLLYTSTRWIAFVDADDWLERDYFERLYDPVERYEWDVIVCGAIRDVAYSNGSNDKRFEKGAKGRYIIADTKEKKKKILNEKGVGCGPCAKMIRKSLLIEHEIFFPEELAYEDMYWNPLLSIYAEKIYILEDNLYHYFVNPGSITLCNNADHHTDMIAIQLIKWEDYDKRGLLREYQEELEKEALDNAACAMRQLVVLYDKPSFSFFQMEREMMLEHITEDKYECYRVDMDPVSRLLLDILYASLDEHSFFQVIKQIKERLVK